MQRPFQSLFTLFESTKHSIHKINPGRHCQRFFPVENTTVAHINPYISAPGPSDHEEETHASQPLFGQSEVTAHLITDQTTVINDPGFYNEC